MSTDSQTRGQYLFFWVGFLTFSLVFVTRDFELHWYAALRNQYTLCL